ncbi:type I pullulanase [Paenibacillus sp. Marseille-Q4541]|uniref:type I pullulanase n=1 Tax=Paenibacillus sp. Marseille-Q4541 TaxID=2831522 RepID=UPI001BA48569|nr:type I pullulanase [Paenibacillus sp. Marseille-Q4541]
MQDLHYDNNDLGLTYSSNACMFKVWAPTASQVEVVLYEDAGIYDQHGMVHNHEGGSAYLMNAGKQGTWSLELQGNYSGMYYMYRVTLANGKINYALDPYAKAVAAGGARTAIIDMTQTNPEDWEDDVRPPQIRPTDAIIYELHVRDFSIDEDTAFQQKGLYRAFTEEGLTDKEGNRVGIDHLVELGITHVHLMPVFDFKTVNELTVHDPSTQEGKYNWGYDPQNFNVPEGSYASDPANPTARITEFKQMIQALHRKGIRVVMDVVYNHTFGVDDGPFEGIVPGYFYRTNSDGYLTNGSGVGNELATERPMVRKYIKDSVRYWAEEYHIDGFRFDLMGLIDVRTMTEITDMLQQGIDRTILVYGEPWTGGDSPLWDKTLKGAQRGKGFAVFNDNYRSAVKGDNDGAASGFATGWWGVEGTVLKGVQGAIHDFTYDPSETINYVTAHDNLNLWDKIVTSQGMRHALSFPEWHNGTPSGGHTAQDAVKSADPYRFVEPSRMFLNDTVRRSLLANGIMITSQGIPFLHAGDEMLRSKYGDHNSYRSGDAVNALRWSNKAKFRPVFEYYQGLVRLRKEHAAFRMEQREQVERFLKVISCGHGMLAYILEGTQVQDSWNRILVVYNGKEYDGKIDLPQDSTWNVVVNDQTAGVESLDRVQGSVTVPRLSMMVLYDKESGIEPQVLTSMEILTPKKVIQRAEEMKLEAVFKDQHGRRMEGVLAKWASSDKQKINIRQTGKLVGLSLGKSTITATCGEVQASVRIIVDELIPTRMEITGERTMYATQNYHLQMTVWDQYDQVLPATSVNLATTTPRIVAVDDSGKLIALRPGKGVITAQCGSLTAEWNVQIHPFFIRTIEIEYDRPDQHYDGWNVWVWGTGVHDGKIPFQYMPDGRVVAQVKVAPGIKRIGYIVRLNEWEMREGDRDFFIDIPPSPGTERVKVNVKSGTREVVVAVGGRQMKLHGLNSA